MISSLQLQSKLDNVCFEGNTWNKISLNFHRCYLLPLIKSFSFHWCCWLIDAPSSYLHTNALKQTAANRVRQMTIIPIDRNLV